ncbi:unnamed protein product [Strongylus vulgaris]|uniref:Uncharacterized protein n=1 Tax=Strongylus vulgaris TaxID=40348 RepID=A0A3P7IVB1_STRVU|nr:unnamed protein product [Strongylus vulgaris]
MAGDKERLRAVDEAEFELRGGAVVCGRVEAALSMERKRAELVEPFKEVDGVEAEMSTSITDVWSNGEEWKGAQIAVDV